jgi:hypothetical protein
MRTEIHTLKSSFHAVGFLVTLLVTLSLQVEATPWKNISRPEKVWSVFHPVKAMKVKRCADRARFVTDSLEDTGTLTDKNGGQLDAFRHAYWMALMILEGMNEHVVRKIGERHEKGNYLDFKRGKTEDSFRPDSLGSVMDLRNNEKGIETGKLNIGTIPKTSVIQQIISKIWNGEMVILRKDSTGNYLDCSGKVVDLMVYNKSWYIPKCLVSSDQVSVEH